MPLSQLQLLGSVWMSNVHTSCPEQPYSAPVYPCLSPLLWSEFLSYLLFLFSYCLYFSQNYHLFQRTLLAMVCSKEESFRFVMLPPGMFQTSILQGPICSAFWCSRIFIELSSKTIFQMKHLFLPTSLLHCPTFESVHSNWKWGGMDDLCAGLWWQIFAVSFFPLIFPLQPFQVSAFIKDCV